MLARFDAASVSRADAAWATADRTCASAPWSSAVRATVSSCARTSPAFTRWFSSTGTVRTTPDSSLETSTVVSGVSVPVALTSMTRSPRVALTVRQLIAVELPNSA